jgi:hypothetical protein
VSRSAAETDILLEPDVALTDFALAAECAAMAAWLYWRGWARGPLRGWFVTFFAATGLGALLGGIAHGFFPSTESMLDRGIWSATLLSIGLAALAIGGIAAHLLFSERSAKRIVVVATALFAVYVAVVIGVSQAFVVAVAYYVPAAAFLLVAFVVAYLRRRRSSLLAGVAGVVLSFVAATVQVTEIGFAPLGLSHNALYHLIQAVALLMIFAAALDIARTGHARTT